MKYEIQIIRCKEDDVLAQYIVEFFKFIGYFVSDYIVTELLNYYSGRSLEAGITVFLGIDEVRDITLSDNFRKLSGKSVVKNDIEESFGESLRSISINSDSVYSITKDALNLLEKKRKILPGCDKEVTSEEKYYYKVLDFIIEQLPLEGNDKKAIKGIHVLFAKHGLFFYMYNNGLLKLIEGWKRKDYGEKLSAIQAANDVSFNQYMACLREILCFKESKNRHVIYASCLLEKLINGINREESGLDLFEARILLERLENLEKCDNDFIRTFVLSSEICQPDDKLRYKAEWYLDKAIEKVWPREGDTAYFLYFKKGQLLEMMGFDNAAKANYGNDMDPLGYRAKYKIASYMERENERAAIDSWEEIITALLNGYGPDNVMPTKRVIAFRACRARAKLMMLHSDIDGAKRDYESALECATLPKVQTGRKTKIDKGNNCRIYSMYVGERSCYRKILEYCMPKYTVPYRI